MPSASLAGRSFLQRGRGADQPDREERGCAEGRGTVPGICVAAIRRIFVESARRKRSLKRGGGAQREELDEAHLVLAAPSEEMLAIDEALDRLAAEDPQSANLVKLRYFVGMTMDEAAGALGLPLRTAERLWTYARAWLRREVSGGRWARRAIQPPGERAIPRLFPMS